jgi:hypothetical protein
VIRRRYVTAFTAVFLLALVVGRSFTGLGHLVAWALGLALALLAHRARPAGPVVPDGPVAPAGPVVPRSVVALEDHPNDLDVEDGEAPELDGQ